MNKTKTPGNSGNLMFIFLPQKSSRLINRIIFCNWLKKSIYIKQSSFEINTIK